MVRVRNTKFIENNYLFDPLNKKELEFEIIFDNAYLIKLGYIIINYNTYINTKNNTILIIIILLITSLI